MRMSEPTQTLVDRLRTFELTQPDVPAIAGEGETVSWQSFGARSDRIAAALRTAGVGLGDRVAILMGSTPIFPVLVAGILKAGGSAVPMPTLVSPDTIALMLADSGARVLFVSRAYRHLVPRDADAESALRVALDFTEPVFDTLDAFCARSDAHAARVSVSPSDEFNVIYSSGTTGRPKGIIHSHRLRAMSSIGMGRIGFPPGARTLIATAAYSNWSMGALIYTLWAGGCVRYLEKFSPAATAEVCGAFKPDNVFVVPVQIARMLDDPARAIDAAPPARKWCAGSYLPTAHKKEIFTRWPGGLIEIYGMTEGAPFTILDAAARPDKLHTVGRSDPPEDVKIIDESGHLLPPGARGEVIGRIRSFMSGYNNDRPATDALVWRDKNGDAYCRSGDIGVLDDEGFLQIVDRKKDVIISGGFNIYASDIEAALLAHSDVSEAAAFAVPSARWGETPAAAVVLRPGANPSSTELLTWTNARLGRAQRLATLVFIDALPRGSLDKVLRRELRDRYRHLGDEAEALSS